MKKSLFLAALAAVVLAGCSKNETGEMVNGNTPIDFGTYVGLSRSTAVEGTAYPKNGSFMTFGYFTKGAELTAGATLNFMREAVTYDGTSYNCTERYWPNGAGDKVSFFAVHPSDVTTLAPAMGAATFPEVTFTVADVAGQVDLMTASVLNQDKDSKNGLVSFQFGHALTKVGFSALLDKAYTNADVKIKTIELAGTLVKSGKYAAALDGNWAWTNDAAVADVSYKPVAKTDVVLTNTAQNVTADNNFPLVMPQTFDSSDAKVIITYSVTPKDTPDLTFDNTAEKTLTELSTPWVIGKFVNYQFSIGLNTVGFEAKVTDWK